MCVPTVAILTFGPAAKEWARGRKEGRLWIALVRVKFENDAAATVVARVSFEEDFESLPH